VIDELRKFGDNDHLSALIAGLVDADVLVLLSDVDGLYTSDPRRDPSARLVPLVRDPVAAEQAYDTSGRGPVGTGGMASKLGAAGTAAAAGIPTVIAAGMEPGTLAQVFATTASVGTLVLPRGDRLTSRKHWIAYTLTPTGTLAVDVGAVRAITRQGRSLLAKGLTAVEGQFVRGACVRCLDPAGREFARGLVNYDAAELRQIKGRHSSEIEAVLGYQLAPEIIGRNDLVLTDSTPADS
jgi:glutamate 5-kinase